MKKPSLFLLLVLFFIAVSGTRANNPVFIRIQDRNVTKQEFERLFNKNNSLTTETSLEDYLEMFINFQLKVVDAEANKLHLAPSFLEELKIYRQQLARPYLTHPDTEEQFLKEAYERILYDVHASHILIKMDPEAGPADTLFAWEKAMRIREQIIAGEEFESVARRASDDPSAKINNGNIGFFTAFQMAYPFEKACYQMPIGEISLPVRTRFGYHIIRVNQKRKSHGELKLQHMLLRFSPGAGKEEVEQQKAKIFSLYERIKTGEDFGQLAKTYSQDMSSAGNNGEMHWFGTGRMIPDFEEQAFSLQDKGSVAEPFRTQYGWHIIRLLDRKSIPSYENIKEELRDKLYSARDERGWVIQKKFVENLKTEYNFSENPGSLNVFFNLPEDWFQPGKGTVSTRGFTEPLFLINNKPVYQSEFADYLKRNIQYIQTTNRQEFITGQYKDFVAVKLMEQEDRNLENKYPDFKYLVQEYYDGLLLFEITNKKIWSFSVADSAGLDEFYKQNRNDYRQQEKYDASIFKNMSENEASGIHRVVARATRRKYSEASIVNNINRRFGEGAVVMERMTMNKVDNPLFAKVSGKKGLSNIVKDNDRSVFFYIHEIMKPIPYPLDEVRGKVIFDYQEYLEEKWIEKLKKTYEVKVDKSILTSLKNKYNNLNKQK